MKDLTVLQQILFPGVNKKINKKYKKRASKKFHFYISKNGRLPEKFCQTNILI